ncbi:PPOX class F420-dependent oxidoreductase [Microbacterium sp. ABRD28]|uniref:PPOX class F420-dependent oxidoreductase n=1 Tax=Microbacterium sp. ABRD28 TaxID=2268461 RepID=UPI000F54F646|nr:PPOX class F420-dependent oxidoreductase [Microbacterium sp. ABRD28]AZC14311.1 PPOX class F420-dependent oxidoreductase [Microbacterium sp. ABRD28]
MASDDLIALAAEEFVSLTTFRRNGIGVPTTVWVARDADRLVVTTGADSGKVKRIRRNPAVTLRPSDRAGRVDPGAAIVSATATIQHDVDEIERCTALFHAKYGLQARMILGLGRVLSRDGRNRVLLHLEG